MAQNDPKTNEKKKTWPAFTEGVSHYLHAIEDGTSSKPSSLDSALYLVATPIGNLGDMTLRALWVLHHADAVLCEDTRVGGKLLHLYGLKKPLLSCHDHNEAEREKEVLARLAKGEALALISDAGTPLIADPGYKLARACRAAGYDVVAVPGASALLAALMSAGLPTDKFLFNGFLPNKKTARRAALAKLQQTEGTLVFYESPQRLAATLADMSEIMGETCEAAVMREMTKLFEEQRISTLGELAAHYKDSERPKGEIVILLAPQPSPENEADWEAELQKALKNMSLRDATAAISSAFGLKKSVVYQKALEWAQEN
jgi:16S rRNA (cytidine1402-2'-O)-methyltransferase